MNRQRRVQILLHLTCGVLGMSISAQAAITHRWDFNTDANDSVGSLNWTSNGGAAVGGGSVNFDGVDDFLELSTSPLPTSGSTTVEAWGTYDPNAPFGSRVFDFASADGDLFLYLTPNAQNAGDLSVNTAVGWDDDFDAEIGPRGGGASNTGNPVLLTFVYDSAAMPPSQGPGEFRIYRDGQLIASRGAEDLDILGFSGVGTTTVNRLGYGISATTEANTADLNLDNPPAFLNGSIDEFRTWNNAMTDNEVFINAVAGPDNPNVSFTDTMWNVAGTDDWNSGGNWSGSSVPADASRAVIANGGMATVTGVTPQAGQISITNGGLTVSGDGALDVKYPVDLNPGTSSTEINVTGGGQLSVSRINGDADVGAKLLNIDGGTVSPNFSTALVGATVGVDVGVGGATFSASAGRRLQIQGVLTGAGNITIEGSGKTAFSGGADDTYTGEVTVNDSTLALSNADRTPGGWNSLNTASRIVLNNSTLEAIPSGGGGNVLRTPVHVPAGTVNTLNHQGVDATAEREPFLQGDITGGGDLHYTTTRTVPIGIDFGGILAVDPEGCIVGVDDPCTVSDETDNSGFTGRLIVDDVSGNAEGMFIAVRIRSEGGDFPNSVFEINSPDSRLGKRGTDANQTIQLGGISGVAGAFLVPSIAGSGTLADDGNDYNDVTFELGGAAEDAVFNGFIRDEVGADFVDRATVVKVGNNTQTFSGPNTYSGTTTVNGGTLLINGTHMMAADAGALPVGDYTVNAGGTLGGTGTIGSLADTVNVNVLGGTLAPGASPGTLTINGSYSQDANSTLAIEIGGTPASGLFDLLDISGTASLAGMLDVSLFNSPSLTVGDQFTVLTASSVSGGSSLALVGSAANSFTLDATSGNSLVLEFIGGGVVDVDLDDDGDVDGRDFLLIQRMDPSLIPEWQAQFGSSGSLAGSLATVPEPGCLWIALSGLLVLGVRRRP